MIHSPRRISTDKTENVFFRIYFQRKSLSELLTEINTQIEKIIYLGSNFE